MKDYLPLIKCGARASSLGFSLSLRWAVVEAKTEPVPTHSPAPQDLT